MTRGEVAETLASVARMAADLVEEAEDETAEERKVSNDLVEQITDKITEVEHLKSELADYEKTVATLREQLRAEEARRASYQAVDGAARRFVARFRRDSLEAPWKEACRPIVEFHALLEALPAEPNDERA